MIDTYSSRTGKNNIKQSVFGGTLIFQLSYAYQGHFFVELGQCVYNFNQS